MNTNKTITKPKSFIPERFQKVIAIHIVKNLMHQEVGVRPPLLLGIHGQSGIGKTYQCEQVLEYMGVKSFLISGGQLESSDAGEPARLLRRTYIKASSSLITKEANAAVVLINDIDTGLGDWGEMVQYTVNRQTVFGELMHLVDYPTFVEGQATQRIPIIITGNDFSKLYKPLLRPGRMTAFKWEPTSEEKVKIVARIFPELTQSRDNCQKLVEEFDSQPIAFFSHLRDSFTDDQLWTSIQNFGIEKICQNLRGNKPNFQPEISYERLLEAGKKLLESGKLVNHLENK